MLLKEERGFGITRACGLVGISRSLYGYRSRRPVLAGRASGSVSSPARSVGTDIAAFIFCCGAKVEK
jgi:hypothetical protein